VNKKRSKEHNDFELFSRDFALPNGEIEYSDRPDVILRGDRTIGIEITDFYLKSGHLSASEPKQRRKRDDVVSTAQRLYREQSGTDVGFSFGFDKNRPIKNVQTVARNIAELAKVLSHEQPGVVLRERYRHIPELSYWYKIEPPNDGAAWRVDQLHSLEIMPIARLKSIVADKEATAKGYQRCDALWLLVVVDFFDRAQDCQLSDREAVATDVFEKILVYKPVFHEIVEIPKPR
jgi:hypothetical protein